MKRKYNYDLVFREIYKTPGLSRANLARATDLTRATISYIVDYFISEGYFEVKYEESDTGKRSGEKIYINEKRDLLMCVEIKKRIIYVYITYGDGTLLEKIDFKYNKNIPSIFKEIKEICIDKKIKIVGISIHGIVDNMGKNVSSTYYEIDGTSVYNDFKESGIEIFFEKDSNVYNNAFEQDTYTDPEYLSNVCMYIGEGIGYSLMIADHLVYGINGDFGDIGHIRCIDSEKQCYCGRQGCYEMHASSDAFIQEFNDLNSTALTEESIIAYYNNGDIDGKNIELLNKYIDFHCKLIEIVSVTAGTDEMHLVANFFNNLQVYKFKLTEKYNDSIVIKFIVDKNRDFFRKGFSRQLLRVLYEIDVK